MHFAAVGLRRGKLLQLGTGATQTDDRTTNVMGGFHNLAKWYPQANPKEATAAVVNIGDDVPTYPTDDTSLTGSSSYGRINQKQEKKEA